jgi:murein DD-endopeptidase MepM/ murein hydrolase activator NlpD
MSTRMNRGSIVWILAGGLAACSTTPAYPTGSDHAAAAPTRPKYAVDAPARAPAPIVVAQSARTPTGGPDSEPAPSATPPTPTPAPVQSAPLAPLTGAAAPPPAEAEHPPPLAPTPQATAPAYHPPPVRYAATGHVVEPHGMFRDYVVQRHDHLYAIARDLQTTPQILIKANHLKNPEHLSPGQHLKVPVEKAYVVQSGDTIALVAKRFSVAAADLADLNDLTERARLGSGDQLALPAGFRDRGPVELPPARLASIPNYRIYPTPPTGGATQLPPASVYVPRPLPEAPGAALSDTQIAALAHNRFAWPVRGEIMSTFGAKGLGVSNDGVDVRSAEGTVVRAAAAGDVVYAGNQIPGFGNLVLLQHADGWVTAYAHLQKMSVQMRQQVEQGQEIGDVGMSGGVSEPQLHFEVRYKGSPGEKARPVDPLLVLPPG